MKPAHIILFVIAFIILYSCKKPGDTPILTEYYLQNKWTVDSVKTYENGTYTEPGHKLDFKGYFDFRIDGKVYSYSEINSGGSVDKSYDTSEFTLNDDHSTIICYPIINGSSTAEEDTTIIETLTERKLIARAKEINGKNSARFYFHK